MIDNWQEVESALTDLTGREPRIKGDEHIHTCPFCDKPGHMYVNYAKGVYNCYRCGGDDPDGRGPIEKLAELLGVTVETDELGTDQDVFDPSLSQNLSAVYVAGEGVLDQVPLYDRNEMPINPPANFEYITINNWYYDYAQAAVQYLAYRGITGEHMYHYKLGLCRRQMQWGTETEVVFTDFNRNGQLRWWQRRAINENSRVGPKYMGPSGDKAGKIGNWYQALRQPVDYIGVAEGPVSGIIAGLEFTWLWGKEHSQEQLETLCSANKRVMIAMDGEAKAYRNAISLATELRDRGVPASIIPLPGQHDPASLGAKPFREILQQALNRRESDDLAFLETVVREYV